MIRDTFKKMLQFINPPVEETKMESLLRMENKLKQLQEELSALEQIEANLKTNLKELKKLSYDKKNDSKI